MEHMLHMLVVSLLYVADGLIMHDTDRQSLSDYDCLYYSYSIGNRDTGSRQLMPYCIRPFGTRTNRSLSNRPYFTFAQLKKNGTSSAQLISWSAPIDIVENYEIYLHETNESTTSFSSYKYFNCSIDEYGPQCEYYIENPFRADFSEIVYELFLYKYMVFQPTLNVPCYIHLPCRRGPEPLCLDWREICDGKKDCADGEDEADCWKVEVHVCAKNEYRCHSGHCISKEFYQYETFSADCADGSDESAFNTKNCVNDPTFRCEEHTCYSRWNEVQFACGDGQCIGEFGECANKRKDKKFLSESLLTSTLPPDCWEPMVCLTGYFLDTDEKQCGTYCWEECSGKIIDNCPEYIQFPDKPIGSDHVYLVYARSTVDVKSDALIYPTFVCYDENKCANDLQPFSYVLNRRCLRFERLNITQNLKLIWAERIAIIMRVFSSMCVLPSDIFQCPNTTLYRCAHSTKCISIHRLVDGIVDCEEGDDETFADSCSLSDVATRFRCAQENKCLSQRLVNNGVNECQRGDDEIHPDQRISRHLFSFTTICDGFQELESIVIDDRKETDETDCANWCCNNTYTHCDGIWNCEDGIDEIGCTDYSFKCPQLHHHCVNVTTGQLICLPLSKVSDGQVDCLGGFDETHRCRKVKSQICSHQIRASYTCSYQIVQTDLRCSNDTKCLDRRNVPLLHDLFCPSGREESKLLHEGITLGCSSGMQKNLTDIEKYFCTLRQTPPKWAYKHFKISETTASSAKLLSTYTPMLLKAKSRQFTHIKDIWPCHRGVLGLVSYNTDDVAQKKCFCPPSYFGDFCQYQNERVSLSIQIQMSAEWTNIFTFVYLLIDDKGTIESYDQLHYLPVDNCNTKLNRYLLYSSRPKNLNRSYSVYFEAYDRQKLQYRASWRFSLQFPFLPVQRLAVRLDVPVHRVQCLLDCGAHGQCSLFLNIGELFCRCDVGWTGERCEQTRQISCNCSPGSLCLSNQICLCELGRHGRRCYLPLTTCSSRSCRNNGTCITLEPRMENLLSGSVCRCSEGFSGFQCEVQRHRVLIRFHDITIPPLMLLHFIEVFQDKPHQRTDSFKKIPVDQESVSIYISPTIRIAFTEFFDEYYLIFVEDSDFVTTTETELNRERRCPSIRQLFNDSFTGVHPLRRIKHYHAPCYLDPKLHCFYDEQHMCLCDDLRRANCFTFDHNKTYNCRGDYGNCENGAQCFQDHEDCPLSSACLCPKCYYGSKCQFNTHGLTMSLDTILGYHIRPNQSVINQTRAVKITISLVTMIFIFGTVNSFLAILTFHAKESRTVGCGVYLLVASVISLVSIWIFTVKYLFLLFSQMQLVTNRSFLLIQCTFLDAFLRVSLSFGDWLIACVAFERATAVIRGIHFNRSKSKQIAGRVCLILLLIIVCSIIHDPVHRRLMDEEEEQRTWCIVRYSTTLQNFDYMTLVFHFLTPFTINLISALTIIIATARSRTNIGKQISFQQHLIKQLYARKQLLISPIVLVVLALPRLIITLVSECMTSVRDPYLYLVGYFTSIIPPLLIFIIFVPTSKIYQMAFREAMEKYFSKWLFRNCCMTIYSK